MDMDITLRTLEIIKKTIKRYYQKYSRMDVTAEMLTYILIADPTTLIFQYMYEKQLFSWYMGKNDSSQYMLEADEEDISYIEVLALIESGNDDLEDTLHTTPIDYVLQQANHIAKKLGRVVDEIVLTIAVIQSENFLFQLLGYCDENDKAKNMLQSHFCEENLVEDCFMDDPIVCGAYYN